MSTQYLPCVRQMLLASAELSETHTSMVKIMRDSCRFLLSLCNDITDITRIEQGRIVVQPAPFDVLECCRDCLDLLSSQFRSGGKWEFRLDFAIQCARDCVTSTLVILSVLYLLGVGITFEFDKRVPRYIIQDKDRVRQIIINLLYNAAKFTPNGGTAIFRVSCFEADSSRKDSH